MVLSKVNEWVAKVLGDIYIHPLNFLDVTKIRFPQNNYNLMNQQLILA